MCELILAATGFLPGLFLRSNPFVMASPFLAFLGHFFCQKKVEVEVEEGLQITQKEIDVYFSKHDIFFLQNPNNPKVV